MTYQSQLHSHNEAKKAGNDCDQRAQLLSPLASQTFNQYLLNPLVLAPYKARKCLQTRYYLPRIKSLKDSRKSGIL